MTTMDAQRRSGPPAGSVAPSHVFHVGDAVLLRRSYLHAAAAGVYHVTATLPPSDGQFQYRVRNEDERHERVVTQDRMEAVVAGKRGTLGTPLS
ncbi:hypothetical protein [Pleomorphomonas sp. NRK KF1]|uniref:hypothetical protein n=1 Tax=Pleomorphomonas sp. NRK KF1 TaxID=2943000 RepID=UPI0020436875|nr:hypothetical protein [Pleomorphomonas sp. NRK KF1]MCM5553968.1 hypothetical protein [Pleomorphomonas sp. NRK KF1]